MKYELNPIEQEYNGITYRSRLEAKYAMLFDVLEWEFEYEPETYRTQTGNLYCPDFYLPKNDLYIEVKPNNYDLFKDGCYKALDFICVEHDFVEYTQNIFVTCGSPLQCGMIYRKGLLNTEEKFSELAYGERAWMCRDRRNYDTVAFLECNYEEDGGWFTMKPIKHDKTPVILDEKWEIIRKKRWFDYSKSGEK